MKVVIEIPEELYGRIKDNTYSLNDRCNLAEMVQATGVEIPETVKLIDKNALVARLGAWDINANVIPGFVYGCIEVAPVVIENS